ncbi:MAG TPA: PAS domain S-box protein [Gemmatimonadales bacterium]|nr:PAS domain S-box protein [Gemmatimonadales bacterium]
MPRKPKARPPRPPHPPHPPAPPEGDLREAVSILTATLESTADGILVVNRTGAITTYNQRFLEMWRIPPAVAQSRNDDQLIGFVLDQLQDPNVFLAKVMELYGRPEAESHDAILFKDGRVFDRFSVPQRVGTKVIGRVWSFRDVSEVRRATEELRRNEERFRALVENSSDVILLLRPDGTIHFSTAAAFPILGYEAGENIGKSIFDLIHPEDLPRARGVFGELMRRPGSKVYLECRARRKDGDWGNLEAVGVNRLDDPSVEAIIVTTRDISDRKRAERVQQATYRIADAASIERSLEDLLRAIHSIVGELMPADNFYVALLEPDGESVTFPYFVDRFDAQFEPLPLGRNLTSYVIRSGLPLLATSDVFEEMVARGDVDEVGAPSIDWLGVPLTLENRTIGVVTVQTYSEGVRLTEADKDILTFVSAQIARAIERRRAQDALRQAEERYRAFVTQSTEAIWRVELDHPIPVDLPEEEQVNRLYRDAYLAECNEAMVRMYGFESVDQAIGARLGNFIIQEHAWNRETWGTFVRSGYRLSDIESFERDRSGAHKIFLNNRIGIVAGGHLRRIWGTQRDVTAQHHLEDQLRQAQKMEAVGRLAGGIAHDFNNILTAILGTCSLMQRDLPAGSRSREDVDEIQRSAARAAGLTRQLLAYSRRQVLQPEVLDLNVVVSEMDKMLQRLIGEDVELVTILGEDLGRVMADPGQIEQVLLNLAVNARDAMPQGGRLTIRTANRRDTPVPGASGQPVSRVMLAITDTGIGMDDRVRSHLFEPFFTTKEVGKGTGLGLATVYGIVRQSGGSISVESAPGKGSTFSVFLPRVEDASFRRASLPAAIPADSGEKHAPSAHILLAEDEPRVRLLTQRVLEARGYRVLAATDGQVALELASDPALKLDLLVTDVVMPGMSGPDLARRLRESRPGLPVVYMSGYADQGLAHEAAATGGAFLSKPFETETLERLVQSALERRAQ